MTNSERQVIEFTRHEFYEKLWSMPTTKVAAELGCSDVLIGKVCKAYDIPKPYAGYWAQVSHGKRPKKTPLPRNDDTSIQKLTFFKYPDHEGSLSEPPRELQYDDDIRDILAATRGLGTIKVGDSLRNPHPLVAAKKADIERSIRESRLPFNQRDYSQRVRTIAVEVSEKETKRALLIMDTLIKAIEKIGGKVEVRPRRFQEHATDTVIMLAGEDVSSIRLREKTNMVRIIDEKAKYSWDRNRTEYAPTGMFVFDSGPSSIDHPLLKDTKTSKIEDRLLDLLLNLIRDAGDHRIRKRKAEEAESLRIEREHIRQAREQELRRRQDELRQQQAQEQRRVDDLITQATSWQQSRVLREFLDRLCALSQSADGTIQLDSDVGRYLRWGFEQAERLDPFRPSPHSILDAKPEDIVLDAPPHE